MIYDSEQIMIRVPSFIKATLEKEAEKRNITISALVRQAISMWIEKELKSEWVYSPGEQQHKMILKGEQNGSI